jgi:hypothetical protein
LLSNLHWRKTVDMDADTLSAIISGGAALLGAGVGGAATYLSSSRTEKRTFERRKRGEQRTREVSASKLCEQLINRMADNLEHTVHPQHSKHAQEELSREADAEAAYKQLSAEVLYLPGFLRELMSELGEILSETENICFYTGNYGGTHYHSPYAICNNIRREVRMLVAAFISSEDIPSRSRIVEEYKAALADLRREQTEYYRFMDDVDDYAKNYDERRNEFYQQHPELKPGSTAPELE